MAAQPEHTALRHPPADILKRVQEDLHRRSPSEGSGFVALQLGASEAKRQWPVESFARLGDALWREFRAVPILLGSKGERPLAERYAQCCHEPFISVCGMTSLPELAATLLACRLLVTNDTGTMHLAAGYNLPIIAFFLATAQPFDTGPYCPGSCSIEPDLECHPCAFASACQHDLACHHAISPDVVLNLTRGFFQNGSWPVLKGCSARIWQSRLGSEGVMELFSLSGHDAEDRTLWLHLLRRKVSHFFDRKTDAPYLPDESASSVILSRETSDSLRKELHALTGLLELHMQQGNLLLVKSVPTVQEKFLMTWDRVHNLLKQSRYLAAFAVVWLEETQAEGKDLPEVLLFIRSFQALLQSLLNAIF